MATQPIYIYGDTVNAVLNTARSRVDDLIQTPTNSPAGSDPDLQDTQIGGMALLRELEDDGVTICLRTQVITNSAWKKFQNYLANLGWRGLIQNVTVPGLGANVNADITINSWLSWNGYFNGTTFSLTPALPATFVSPLEVRERVAGSNTQFQPMDTALAGLRPLGRSTLNRQWEWRSNGLYLPGSTGAVDLQIRSVTLYSDFVATTGPSVPWYLQQVPIPGALSAFAWYIAYEVCFPRGDETGAAQALLQCQDEAGKVFNQQARADQRVKQITESIPRPTPVPEES